LGPCHHGMARPQVADRGTASNVEGSCGYIKEAVADSRQVEVLQIGGWVRCQQLHTVKRVLLRVVCKESLGPGLVLWIEAGGGHLLMR
jgi:hypothetical protein